MSSFNTEDKYIIPHNYTDNGKILGIVEKQSLYLAAIWFVPMTFLNFRFLPFGIDISIYVEILLVIPPTIFAIVGIGGETLIDFICSVYSYYKKAKLYEKSNKEAL